MGSTGDDIRELGKKAAAGKVSSQEFDILQTQILSSMYQEGNYRERRRQEDHEELSKKIDLVIENQKNADLNRDEMQKVIDRHELYLRGIFGVLALVMAWIVPNVLDRLFS